MRRLARQIDFFFIDIASAAAFGRVAALDDRVAGCVKMRGCVPMG